MIVISAEISHLVLNLPVSQGVVSWGGFKAGVASVRVQPDA